MAVDAGATTFVTGAAGFIGTELVKGLVARGHRVFGLTPSMEAAKRVARRPGPITKGNVQMMVNKVAVIVIGTLFVVGCGQKSSPSSPSSTALGTSSSSSSAGRPTSATVGPQAQGESRVGFGFNGTVKGFLTGKVFLTGGGSYDRAANVVHAGGGFNCIDAVLQGPLSISINPNDPGPCLSGEGVRWDTAALVPSTTFKCTGAAGETLKPAVTSDHTVVLQADFYRASDGNDESFTGKIILSDGDIAPDFPGVNLWVEKVGCGAAVMNFSR
jgi:hypothetical protein